jgi:Raf kinase inhibitor-like YbhB/YbcL family protein
MKITSPDFEDGEMIPGRFSQYYENHSPTLQFSEVPDNTLSLALIMDDPDAPKRTFTHWIAYNIDPKVGRFEEDKISTDATQGRNDTGDLGYAGPKPPDGEHRYFFRLYALKERIDLPEGASRKDVEEAMSNRVLAEAELMGRFATPGYT